MRKTIMAFLLIVSSVLPAAAQNIITGHVVDAKTLEPVIGATVTIAGEKGSKTVTDINGEFRLSTTSATKQQLHISYIGYKSLTSKVLSAGTYKLTQDVASLGEVVVTAQESRGLTSASVIEKHAMEHLQPSSFSDILELLPGGRAQDPTLTSTNNIRIRETGTASDYNTSSLGTSFVIDGAPVSTNANRQSVKGAWETSTTSRDNLNSGVDMRSIATDDIEKVEIVRGIPSVEYGDLTSGLVKIERKKGGKNWEARLKADMSSKLFYLAKGFEWKPKKMTLNLSADYLDAKADPRNLLENYKRLSFSVRFGKGWGNEKWHSQLSMNLDYTGSFDNDKIDPDLNNQAEDSYKSQYNRYAFLAKFNLSPKKPMWFKSLDATFSSAYEYDLIERTKLVQLSSQTAVTQMRTDGESEGIILPYKYTAYHNVEGKPFNAFAKLNAKFQVPSSVVSNTFMIGTDWNMDKNYGRGQIYDETRPLYTTSTGRMYDTSTIPSNHQLSLYAEENVSMMIAGNKLELAAGIRGTQMLNLPGDYLMHGKFYWDPRANIGWTFPRFKVFGKTSFIRLSGGVGEHTKMPTMEQLFPDMKYIDLVQLNYYHANADYRKVSFMTYVINPVNKNLKPARNLKWEVSTDINIGGNRLSVTYFRENMTSGFRTQSYYSTYTYKWYDRSAIDGNTLTAPPVLEDIPYETRNELRSYDNYTNGSQTLKEGIEYTFSTIRWKALMTRLTINGAWFHTTYRNSLVETYRPSAVVNNQQIQYVGYYEHDGGSENQMLNTNFTLDTDIPKLRLGFSLSAQCMWFTMHRQNETSNYPVSYLGTDGVMHEWKDEDASDIYLRYLVRNYTESNFTLYRVPFCMNLNLKVTKKLFGDRLNIALFCNKLLDYNPSYERNGMTVRRQVTPYFGLEMNVKI